MGDNDVTYYCKYQQHDRRSKLCIDVSKISQETYAIAFEIASLHSQ